MILLLKLLQFQQKTFPRKYYFPQWNMLLSVVVWSANNINVSICHMFSIRPEIHLWINSNKRKEKSETYCYSSTFFFYSCMQSLRKEKRKTWIICQDKRRIMKPQQKNKLNTIFLILICSTIRKVIINRRENCLNK